MQLDTKTLLKQRGETYTANEMRNPDPLNDTVRHIEGFYVFKQ